MAVEAMATSDSSPRSRLGILRARGPFVASLVFVAACSIFDDAEVGGAASPSCEGDTCTAPDGGAAALATDGIKDGTETDVDCGGPGAPPCGVGKSCQNDADCVDKYCAADTKRCVVPRNDDGVRNGTETDVDCGGQSGNKCGEGLVCTADSDCEGACNYAHKCSDAPSCKPHFGGDTCGGKPLHPGEYGDPDPGATQESCCRSLPVPGYDDPTRPGKQVFVDKYEITAGRIRAFVEALAAENNGEPDIKSWIAAHRPQLWDEEWDLFLPSGADAAEITLPRSPDNFPPPKPWIANAGTNSAFGSPLYLYAHGNNCGNYAGSYGFPTYWYPDALLTGRGEVPRAQGVDENGTVIPPKDALDVKSMTCIPNAILAAFCHWDGGQLATDEVLDFITDAPANLGNGAGCGKRCAPVSVVQAAADSGSDGGPYVFPYPPDDANHDGSYRIATPGRVYTDVVRINAGDEPWMDLEGNAHEVVLDLSGATFAGKFGLKYLGMGYLSARAGANASGTYTYPEYKAAYSGGRCMRFK